MTIPGYPGADPTGGLIGGVLIGLSAALMLLGAGRIAGVSGIAARATGITERGMERLGAITFLIALPVGALIASAIVERRAPTYFDWPYLIVAGLIVGFGTRLGSGCTSGHGVCGLSRLSARSIIATLTFILTGVATVAVMNRMGLGS